MERLRAKLLEGEAAIGSSLVRNLKEKRRLLESGDESHRKIKTAIVMGGGGVRGAYGAGVLLGLEQLGYQDTFDVVVGVSSGAADLAYFLGGQTGLGAALWYEDLIDKRFIDLKRLKRILDLDFADKLMRTVKPLDQAMIKKSRSDFFVGVTNAKTGEGKFIDGKDKTVDVVSAVIASSAFPIAYNKTVTIGGVEYGDGSITSGIPVDLAIEKGATDILVVLNGTIADRANGSNPLEKILIRLLMRKAFPGFREAMVNRHQHYSLAVDLIELHGESINIGIISPSDMPISRISQDAEKIFNLAMAGKEQAVRIFG